jgi:hypothetical protein
VESQCAHVVDAKNCELGKRHSKRGKKDGKGKGEARWPRVCLSIYSITENIYYSQLSSVALLLQPERNCFISYNTRKGLGSVSLCAVVLRSSPPSHVSTCNGQRSSQLFFVHYNSVCSINRFATLPYSSHCVWKEKEFCLRLKWK